MPEFSQGFPTLMDYGFTNIARGKLLVPCTDSFNTTMHAPLWLHWIRYETQVSHGVPFEAGNFGAD